jgi:undecaprenyl-diphosphatase
LTLTCLSAVLVLAFAGLFQLDRVLAREIQSIDVAWFEDVGHVGQLLGSWQVLVGVSVVFLLIGLVFSRSTAVVVGFDTLVAHGIVALLVQTLKHLIGRPRPRLAQLHLLPAGPSFESGWDSFPSGHSAAAFSIAAVIAARCPRAGWIAYGGASLIAASRVVTGSHFPSDILAGVLLGLTVGVVVANPLAQWRASVQRLLDGFVPYLVGFFSLVWIALHEKPSGWGDATMLGLGATLMVTGLILGGKRRGGESKGVWADTSLVGGMHMLILGLALTSGSLMVTVLVALALVGYRLSSEATSLSMPAIPGTVQPWMGRIIALAILAGAVWVVQGVKGILPLL